MNGAEKDVQLKGPLDPFHMSTPKHTEPSTQEWPTPVPWVFYASALLASKDIIKCQQNPMQYHKKLMRIWPLFSSDIWQLYMTGNSHLNKKKTCLWSGSCIGELMPRDDVAQVWAIQREMHWLNGEKIFTPNEAYFLFCFLIISMPYTVVRAFPKSWRI